MNRYTIRQAVLMELRKARSLPAITWTLITGMVATAAFGVLAAYNTRNPGGDPTSNMLAGILVGQLITGVVGALAITGEFDSGMAAVTFAAIPRRATVLTAKALVWGAVFLVAGEVTVLAAFLGGTAVLRASVPHPSLASPEVLRAVLMTGAYLALTGLIGLGVGALIRRGAAAVATVAGGLFVLPLFIGVALGRGFGRLLPELIAGNSLAAVKPVAGFTWSPWLELAIVAVYPAVLLLAGGWQLQRRDA
jgi:ABC-2 type transport system permease protein